MTVTHHQSCAGGITIATQPIIAAKLILEVSSHTGYRRVKPQWKSTGFDPQCLLPEPLGDMYLTSPSVSGDKGVCRPLCGS